jgi:hypothetical protein
MMLGLLLGNSTAHADAIVNYSSTAPENNYGAPTAFSDQVAYSISLSENATDLFGTVTERSDLGGTYNAGSLFANLYFGTGASAYGGSDFGIEVTNDRAFIPGQAGFYSLAGTGFSFTANATTGVITFTLPWAFLETDPLGMGFSTVSAANPDVLLRLSQSLGYSVAGGIVNYGPTDLGLEFLPPPAQVPEPGSLVLLGTCVAVALAWRSKGAMTAILHTQAG